MRAKSLRPSAPWRVGEPDRATRSGGDRCDGSALDGPGAVCHLPDGAHHAHGQPRVGQHPFELDQIGVATDPVPHQSEQLLAVPEPVGLGDEARIGAQGVATHGGAVHLEGASAAGVAGDRDAVTLSGFTHRRVARRHR